MQKTDKPVHSARTPFFRMLSPRSRAVFFTAVFLTFAPLSLLMISGLAPRRDWWVTSIYWMLSGTTAILFAGTYLVSRKLLWAAIPLQSLWVILPGVLAVGRPNISFDGIASVVLVALGYVFFVMFISGEGTRTVRLLAEMSLAQDIHATLVPPITRRVGRLELFGHSYAGQEMGGDLIDVIETPSGVIVYIADVSGHGVRAGVVMAMVKSTIRMKLRHGDDLDELMLDLNVVLCELLHSGMFVTLACLRVNHDGTGIFVGAGHGPVIQYRTSDGSLVFLESQHLPLGVSAGESFHAERVMLGHDDVLLFMTDGLTEVFDSKGRPLGQQPIEQIFRDQAASPLATIHEKILTTVRAFGRQVDDQTLLLGQLR